MRVLSIDFDYFQNVTKKDLENYPDGHDLPSIYSVSVWASVLAQNPNLEKIGIIEEEYDRMLDILANQQFVKGVLISQSHKDIYDFIVKNNPNNENLSLTNVDMHHDMFNNNDELDCGNWIKYVKDKYPTNLEWICNPVTKEMYGMEDDRFGMVKEDLSSIIDKQYDYIFLCRSNQWLPPQLDDMFADMRDFLIRRAIDSNENCSILQNMDVKDVRSYKTLRDEMKSAFDKLKKKHEKGLENGN